ncbi:MAG: thioredoxin family protein [Spirochaetales bacterium]|uniref:Thioredoxin family protein n=1 Tax=Candidatus Thalassospirochaeta sargassi TaxID=3119039 RepID=A0AAJ1IEW5_9SPIO|nr:thioredoxin family protein [Spirochaetales bacterium]
MSLTPSTMLPLGTTAPDFNLKDPDGISVNLDSFKNSKALLVVFICNHCPYVLHIIDEFSKIAAEYQKRGLGVVGINSNDVETYPQDSPEKMSDFINKHNLSFPYLYDESQSVGREYRAACTPDFFLFDEDRKLVYRGQLDESRPANDIPVSGGDLKAAMDAVLAGRPVPGDQKPSMGCNIKWKAGNEPDYF